MAWQLHIDRHIRIIATFLVGLGFITSLSDTGHRPAQTPPTAATLAVVFPGSPTATAVTTAPAAGLLPTSTRQPTASPTLDPLSLRPTPGSLCGYDQRIEELLRRFDHEEWAAWIEMLSGEEPVRIHSQTTTILTRYSETLFADNPQAGDFEFVLDQLRQWSYQDNVDLFLQAYRPKVLDPGKNWKNIVVLIPGKDPEVAHEQVLLTAHLDSITVGDPEEHAPGADDNASGVATLLDAARALKDLNFRRTIKIVFFSGEELGLNGSQAYVSRYASELADIIGVFNLDMFGYDADNDRCFEIHVGWQPQSHLVDGCLADTLETYDFNLTFDYIVRDAIRASDHAAFWDKGVGAIEILENFRTDGQESGCGERDVNPYYHTENDVIANLTSIQPTQSPKQHSLLQQGWLKFMVSEL